MSNRCFLGLIMVISVSCASPFRGVDPNAPRTLTEALDRLQDSLPPETVQEMRDGSEDDMGKYHIGLGMWMRNNWGLWKGGPLYDDLSALGLFHPDDMSAVILTSFWRQLHNQPLEIEAQVATYKEYWRLATPPKSRSNSACKGEIKMTLSSGFTGLQMGVCCADGVVWSYHVDRGWYRPTDAEMAIWNDSRSHGMGDPCK